MVQKQITLSQAIDGYFIAAHARRLSPHTLADYDNTFRKFEAFLDDNPPLAAITPDHIRRFLNSLTGLSAKTTLNYHVGLSALWTWAIQEGFAEQYIVRQVQPPRPEQRQIVPYTKRDIKAMLRACDRSNEYARPGKRRSHHRRPSALRDRAIITLLVDIGIRATTPEPMPSPRPVEGERVDIEPYCSMDGKSPIHIRQNQPVTLKWRWDATSRKRVQDHIDAARYEILLDGQRIYADRRGDIKYLDKKGFYRVLWYADVGALTPGEHKAERYLSWSHKISDGWDTYGPGGKIETEWHYCNIIVR